MDNIIIYNTEDGETNVKLYANDGTVWMTQKSMSQLFECSTDNISLHLKNIFSDNELDKKAVTENSSVTATDGKTYQVTLYNLNAVLAVGFRVRSKRGVQFRKWANTTLKEYMQKGFVIDSERLKNPDGRPDYFDELLEQIRDIRASEKRFYQKLKDLFALSSDYDKTDIETTKFFTETQNKLIYGVTGKTAAELIVSRADANKPNMALTSWKGKIVRKQDITIAKNYLTHNEVDSLNRLVSIFLESAELRVKLKKDLTLTYWRNSVNKLLIDHDIPLLNTPGQVSHASMVKLVNNTYTDFDTRRKKEDAKLADLEDLKELEELISKHQ
ncbi:virulence RhuM family protein [Veillonella criceti]|uniref:Virulence protein n=1 Tax=Veillonella criceti TaxID=103891 RepID=A0A380NLQ7_9FIRM|nr:virulence RhuM family protein [Veillonella criceti]SUP42467.1 Virulence protein [Veillonella criceti]